MVLQQDIFTVSVGSIEVEVTKKGQGQPLVYLHGAFGYQAWHPFLDKLAEQFTVYAPVHPGFSDNDGIDQIDNILELALHHIDLIEALGLDKPNIVGHFNGGMMAAEIAAICFHNVGKLVLAAPAGIWLDDAQGVDYFATPAVDLKKLLFADPDSELASAVMPEAQTDEERGLQAIDRVRSLSTIGKFLWPIPDQGLKRRMGRIKCPTLIVVGENDQIVPASYADEFTNRIPGSRQHMMAGAGHMFILEQPDAFADVVMDFLNN